MKKLFITLMIISALCISACSDNAVVCDDAIAETPLKDLAKKHNLMIGAACHYDNFEDKEFVETLLINYNQITPESCMKMSLIQPKQDEFDFERADYIVEFARENDIEVKGHALIWHLMNPAWLENRQWTKDELVDVMDSHITAVVSHYKGQVAKWDVVNEPVTSDGLRENIWQKTIGEDYIELALRIASKADSSAKLYINDYNVAEYNKKSTVLYDLSADLLEKGVPLNGVGFQLHIDASKPIDMQSVYKNVKRFTSLGLEVSFTEVDVRIRGIVTKAKLEMQADIYAQLMAIAAENDMVICFTTWGMTDKYSWIPTKYLGYSSALLFDRKYNGKPALYAIKDILSKESITLD